MLPGAESGRRHRNLGENCKWRRESLGHGVARTWDKKEGRKSGTIPGFRLEHMKI